MPWLEKGKVLLIHVPRCAGTSILKHNKVLEKALLGRSIFKMLGIKYYSYRYALQETRNISFLTYENLIALLQTLTSTTLFALNISLLGPVLMWSSAFILFVHSTFLTTAFAQNTDFFRKYYFILNFMLFNFLEDTRYLLGVNFNGHLQHLTAEQCVRFGYVTPEEMKACSVSIVRNPFSRMVSIYEYNKAPFQTFDNFVDRFHKRITKLYEQYPLRDDDKEFDITRTDAWYHYSHELPITAFTHKNRQQIVACIVKQEDLKNIDAISPESLPDLFREKLTGIPHDNSRQKKRPWAEYYDKSTYSKVLKMYRQDFELLGYSEYLPNLGKKNSFGVSPSNANV